MALSLDDLNLLPPTGAGESGTPMRIALDAIDEDPDQPRQEFDDQSLADLAETIRTRGVRQPVSVRPHPMQPGRWMLNFGARRLRASRLAEMDDIPAFVDHTANSVDQFIENEQRKGLTPLEIALFVQRALNRGETQAEVARAIGKSRQYVMIATALIDAPEWLMVAYREGRCRGMNELHELRKLHALHPKQLEAWAAENPSFTRDRVAALRLQLEQGAIASLPQPPVTEVEVIEPTVAPTTTAVRTDHAVAKPRVMTGETQAPQLLARLDGILVRVVTHAIPEVEGHVYVQSLQEGERQVVEASRLALIGFAAC